MSNKPKITIEESAVRNRYWGVYDGSVRATDTLAQGTGKDGALRKLKAQLEHNIAVHGAWVAEWEQAVTDVDAELARTEEEPK